MRTTPPHAINRVDKACLEALTELGVTVAAPGQLLQVSLQHVGEQIAGAQLHRVPAHRLTHLRHGDPQQRASEALTHLSALTVPVRALFWPLTSTGTLALP